MNSYFFLDMISRTGKGYDEKLKSIDCVRRFTRQPKLHTDKSKHKSVQKQCYNDFVSVDKMFGIKHGSQSKDLNKKETIKIRASADKLNTYVLCNLLIEEFLCKI